MYIQVQVLMTWEVWQNILEQRLNWEKFKTNFETIKRDAPHITIHASPTIGILNIESYIEFHSFCLKNNWLNPHSMFNYISVPEEMNICSMPMFYKEQMVELYQTYIETLTNDFSQYQYTCIRRNCNTIKGRM